MPDLEGKSRDARPRLLLADDHTLVAEGLRRLLEAEYEMAGIVENGRDLGLTLATYFVHVDGVRESAGVDFHHLGGLPAAHLEIVGDDPGAGLQILLEIRP